MSSTIDPKGLPAAVPDHLEARMSVPEPLVFAALMGGLLTLLGLASLAWGADSRPSVEDDRFRRGPLDRAW